MAQIRDLRVVAPKLGLGDNISLDSGSQGLTIKKKNGDAARVQIAPAVASDDAVCKQQLDDVEAALQSQLSNLSYSAGDGIDALALSNGLIQLALGANSGLIFNNGLIADLESAISASSSTHKAPSARAVSDAIEAARLKISSTSSSFVSINSSNELVIEQLLINDVIIDSDSNTIEESVLTAATSAAQKGDFLALTKTNARYIHTGGTSGTAADWLQINTISITDAEIRLLISVESGSQSVLSYDPVSGQLGFIANNESFEYTIDGLTLKAAGVKQGHIDFGTASNQVKASDLPVTGYSWQTIVTPSSTQDALEKLDAAAWTSSGNLDSRLTVVEGDLLTKANDFDLLALTNRVSTAESDIDSLEVSKANQLDLTVLEGRVSTAEVDIDTLEISKADQVALDSLEGALTQTQQDLSDLQLTVDTVQTSVTSLQSSVLALEQVVGATVRKMIVEFTGSGLVTLGTLPANARAIAYHVTLDQSSSAGSISIGTSANPTEFVPVGVFDVTSQDDTMLHFKTSNKSGSDRDMVAVFSGVDSSTTGVVIVEFVLF